MQLTPYNVYYYFSIINKIFLHFNNNITSYPKSYKTKNFKLFTYNIDAIMSDSTILKLTVLFK